MTRLRQHLTYANVASSLAVFLLLGGTAFAASQLAKNSVGAKQLQKNAVTAAKIKKNAVTAAKLKKAAVTGAKIKAGAVGASQIADGAVTGAEINAGSTPFSRIVGTIRQNTAVPFTGGLAYPIGTYTQPVGEADVFLPSMEVTFDAGCTSPRLAQAFLLVNPANPTAPSAAEIIGTALVEDKGAGTVTRRVGISQSPPGIAALNYAAPLVPTQRTFFLYLLSGACSSGSGVQLTSAQVDVLGTPVP